MGHYGRGNEGGIVASELRPEHPHEAGVEEAVPELAQIEGARLLANRAAEVLGPIGFSELELEEWALTYIEREGSGDLDSFIAWIRSREQAHGDIP
jgi:hypothetical protein